MSISRLMQMGAAGAGGPTGLASASYDNISGLFGGGQISSAEGFSFSPSGTQLLLMSATSSQMVEFTLSTGFNLASASYVRTKFFNSQTVTGRGITFNGTGTQLIIADQGPDELDLYSISPTYSINSFSFSGLKLDVSSQTTSANGVTFNNDGTKLYVCGLSNAVYTYNVSVPYLVNYGVYSSTFNPTDVSYAFTVRFNSDGTFCYVIDGILNRIVEFVLSTPFDLSSAVHNFTLTSTSFGISSIRDVAFNSDFTKMFVLGRTNCTIYQFSITPPVAP